MSEPLGPGWAAKKPPPSGDGEKPPKPQRFWWRFVLASLIIMAVSAAATSISVLNFFDSIAAEISPENKRVRTQLEKVLAEAKGGEPQNFLLVGSDKRAGAEFAEDKGRSDTTILIRVDPEKGLISMLSIPRDLKVEIPGLGTGKFNEAYFYGGTKGTAEVVKQLTGLPINHVINIDFLGFAQAVYAIGCVFTDVDRRYYHSNEGVPASEQYAEINVQPGYQLMCGKQALDYVRYRHTDTDIVRSARQQDFLGFARQQISPNELAENVIFDDDSLVDVFTEYTTSDISEGKELLDVMKLLIEARSAKINEVHFPAELGPSYVYASQSQINEAVNEFLGVKPTSDGGEKRQSAEERERDKKGRKKGKDQKPKKKKEKPVVEAPPAGSDDLVPAREAGEMEAKIAARRVHGHFPIYYPTRLPAGAYYVESNPYEKISDPRVYGIREGLDKDSPRHEAYRMVLVMEASDGTHYFGVQGIRGWSDPPILDDPAETKEINGREYEFFTDGGQIKLIAWHRGENSYWISNDLLESLSNDQMVGMARSAAVMIPEKKPKKGRKQG
ncbi:MAG: polyisoprenyl-teichoic acid--peptidoglycan teichoic acid transferase [Solirubrobacterales bacterium]|jgi:LCP family protein required for cell wall assembly|nr:polyisoprenyl-teichoic acid--peptidoglycan teichoic acid transferase [Solirubrobacterales bacterium]